MSARRLPAATAAFVLHRYDWSETSLILDLYTREQGRVTVAAKGAKRPYSQLRSVLLPFQRIVVSVSRPSRDEGADVLTLRSAEWAGGAPMMAGAALFSGFYLNELLMKLLARHDPHPRLFDVYTDSLPALAVANDTLNQAALRAFELVLLREIGLLPALDRLSLGAQRLSSRSAYLLRADAGLSEAPAAAGWADGALSGAQWAALQAALDDDHLPSLQRVCAETLTPLKVCLRGLLHYHLGSPRLRTRDVMIDAQQWLDTAVPAASAPLTNKTP